MNHKKELDAAVDLVNEITSFKRSCPFDICGADHGELHVRDARVFGVKLTEEEFNCAPYNVLLSFRHNGVKVLSVHDMSGEEVEDA